MTEPEIYSNLLLEYHNSLDENKRKIISLTSDTGFEKWISVYRKPGSVCNFEFYAKKNRFALTLDKTYIKNIKITDQLAYILGFESYDISESTVARFIPDMRGGVSSFHVYAPGLIEPMVIGDVSAPVLRIVNIRGNKMKLLKNNFFLYSIINC
uniref:Uncharacterized protein n=1 Tax=Meloidogyne enterolobii TaxID=390850 RepID=A0A6V7X0Y8_MELEN|nr:unnamed protein product [Meloidogyne enterolobii]CAD2192909.1 unnamed protein product [Meloidogyne enterolobii]